MVGSQPEGWAKWRVLTKTTVTKPMPIDFDRAEKEGERGGSENMLGGNGCLPTDHGAIKRPNRGLNFSVMADEDMGSTAPYFGRCDCHSVQLTLFYHVVKSVPVDGFNNEAFVTLRA
jgi:hypothetical protein